MLYGLRIAASINDGEPGIRYFASLEHDAIQCTKEQSIGTENAHKICEYIDCVDSGAMPVRPSLYNACVAALTEYLNQRLDHPVTKDLTLKSWAALTLYSVLTSGARLEQSLGSPVIRQVH